MSDVKINNKVYNGITKVILPLADGTGSAQYSEDSGGEVDEVLYPLSAGVSNTLNLSLSVSGSHHIDGQFVGSGLSGQVLTVGLWPGLPASTGSPSGDTRTHGDSYTWFTIPSGANVTFKIENLTTNGINGIAFGVTKPNTTTSIDGKPIGVDGGQISGTVSEYSFVAASNIRVSAIFLIVTGASVGADFSFDINVTVNGTRWV